MDVEELVEAIAQTYVEYTAPLVYLIEKISESRQSGNTISPAQLEDFVEEATSSACNIFPLRTLLSSLKNTDMGKAGNPTSGFISRVINEAMLITLENNMAQATTRLIKDYTCAKNPEEDIDRALKRASTAICIELERIKNLNRGFLPHPDLKELWDRFSCRAACTSLDLS